MENNISYEFEFDINKSKINKEKHGIDFKEAQLLWKDPSYIEVPIKSEVEKRWLVIGKINKKIYSGFITYRKNIIRIISVRRARKNEENIYESI